MSDQMLERSLKFIILLLALILLAILVIPFTAEAQIVIKRSIRPGNTNVIHDLSTNAITISGSTLTATNPFPDSIGVGDAVQYDSSNSGAVTSIAFLHSRTSSTVWTVKRANGSAPSPCTADTDGDIFGAYTSMANYVAATENTGISATVRNFEIWGTTSLITTTQERHVVCYPGTDATTVSWNGWDSNSTYQLKIYSPCLSTDVGTSQRHAGRFTGRCYFLSGNNATGMMTITTASSNAYNITLTGIQIKNTVGDGFHDASGSAGTTALNFDSCIFIGSANSSASTSHSGIDGSSTQAGTYKVKNSIFYSWASTAPSNNNSAIHMNSSGGTLYAYNSSDFGSDRSFALVAGTGVAKNLIGNNGGGSCFLGSWDAASTNNISKRSDAPGSSPQNATVVAWVDSTNFDFHLKSTDTKAKDAGVNLSADATLPFTNDMDGNVRSGTWDIGPDEQGATGSCGVASASITTQRRRAIIQ